MKVYDGTIVTPPPNTILWTGSRAFITTLSGASIVNVTKRRHIVSFVAIGTRPLERVCHNGVTLPILPAFDLATPGLSHAESGGERLFDLFLTCLAEAREITSPLGRG